MARLNSTTSESPLVNLTQTFAGSTQAHATANMSVSTESFAALAAGDLGMSPTFGQDFETVCTKIRQSVKNSFGLANPVAAKEAVSNEALALGFFGKEPTAAQVEAAAIVHMLMAGDKSKLRDYHKRASSTLVESQEGVTIIGMPAARGFSYMESNASMEAYDARNIENLRGYNVTFAFAAAIQDEYGEAFFRTVTITPDTAGFELETRRAVVMQQQFHPSTGVANGWDYKNLIDAYNDPTILIDDSTRIYPSIDVADPQSTMLFTDVAKIAPEQITANGGALIWTSPLRPNVSIDLLGVGANSAIPGKLDQQASIDGAPEISDLYFEIATVSGTSIIHFAATGYQGNNFLKSAQFRDRRMTLDFPLNDIYVDGSTQDISGAVAPAFAFLTTAPYASTQLRLSSLINGQLDLQMSTLLVNGSDGTVLAARDIKGPNDYENITASATLADLRSKVTSVKLIGYKVKAFRANLERRQLGLLIDSVAERARWMVPLSPPISLQRPITDTPTANDLAGPLNAIRLRNSINAVTQMLETRSILRNAVKQVSYRGPTDQPPAIEGFARIMVRPVLIEDTINVADIIQNTSSHTRTTDVAAALYNKLRYGVAYAYTESRYQPVIDGLNGTPGERPVVVIGTDPVTATYLQIDGDPRLFAGLGFKHKIVVTYDVRHRGLIACSFVRESQNEIDQMSHGVMANIPELVTNCVLPINGGNSDVTQVQSRTRHIPLLPIQLWYTVEGLEQAATDRADFKVDMS